MQQHSHANPIPLAHLFAAVAEQSIGKWFCKAMALSLGIDIIVLNAAGMCLFTKTSIMTAESSAFVRMKLSPTSLQPQAELEKDGLYSRGSASQHTLFNT